MSYRVFNKHADGYDDWFDSEPGATIFATEVECLHPLLHNYSRPYLEVGTGSGRFAQALGIEYGVEPAPALLKKARARGIRVKRARGEKLPFPDSAFGGVLIALTLCFVADPALVLREVSRVLTHEGGLVLGLILKESPWARFYETKAKEGHPVYSNARFFTRKEIEDFLRQSGFDVVQYRSTLFQSPGQSSYQFERPVSAYRKTAGFTAISGCKRTT